MNPKNKKNNKAFSLIETVIYISAFALISLALVEVILSINKSYSSIKTNQAMEMSASDIFNRLSRDIRNGVSYRADVSTFGQNPGILLLETKDGTGNSKDVKYFIDNDKALIVEEEGVVVGKISDPQNIKVSNLIFRKISQSNNSTAIKVELTLSTIKNNINIEESFYSTFIMRGTY